MSAADTLARGNGWARCGGGHVLHHDGRQVADVLYACAGRYVPVVWTDDEQLEYVAGPPTHDLDAAQRWAEAECRKWGLLP